MSTKKLSGRARISETRHHTGEMTAKGAVVAEPPQAFPGRVSWAGDGGGGGFLSIVCTLVRKRERSELSSLSSIVYGRRGVLRARARRHSQSTSQSKSTDAGEGSSPEVNILAVLTLLTYIVIGRYSLAFAA